MNLGAGKLRARVLYERCGAIGRRIQCQEKVEVQEPSGMIGMVDRRVINVKHPSGPVKVSVASGRVSKP